MNSQVLCWIVGFDSKLVWKMARRLTERNQISFNEEELRRIVSDLPSVNNDQATVADENVVHQGTEIYSRLGVVSEIFRFNFNVEQMMERYSDELPGNIVLKLVIRRMISHLLSVAIETLTHENMLFRLFFDAFPEREYTTSTVTQEDLTVDRLTEKLNEHLQSNDTIEAEGVWRGNMVVSRVVIDRRRRRRLGRGRVRGRDGGNFNDNDDVLLEGQGKFEKYKKKLGLIEIDVDENCLGHAILLGMSIENQSNLYKAFLAGFDRYLEKVVKSQLEEIENSCLVESESNDVKNFSMRKLCGKYLCDKQFNLSVYSKQNDDVVHVFQQKDSNFQKKIVLYHNNAHFDLIDDLGLFLYGRKVHFCQFCNTRIRDPNNHICYLKFACYKCKEYHLKNHDILSHVMCPGCNVSFDSEFCLRSHLERKIEIGIRNFVGKKKMSPCEIFKFCQKCGSYVRRFHYSNNKGNKKFHNCELIYCKICEKKKKKCMIVFYHLKIKMMFFIQEILMKK